MIRAILQEPTGSRYLESLCTRTLPNQPEKSLMSEVEKIAGTASSRSVMITADALTHFTQDVFRRMGLSDAQATHVAAALVWADLRGISTHGVSRIPRYAEWIASGVMNPRPKLTVITDTPASVLLDADRAPGPVAMLAALDSALEKARAAGIGLALVRATTHTAALGYYTEKAAQQGFAALATAASIPNMAYHGARAAGVSTSPISIAVPGGTGGPLILDMATGMISMGRLAQARRNSELLPPGSALDQDGHPTNDPELAEIPLPMAGPKGSGLALMMECITSLIVANPILADTVGKPAKGRRHRQNALILAIDIARFGDPVAFSREAERLVAALKSLPPDPATGEILMPGERGHRTYAHSQRDGIPLGHKTLSALDALAARIGMATLSRA